MGGAKAEMVERYTTLGYLAPVTVLNRFEHSPLLTSGL
jgi:hypothetical protein